MTDTVHKTPLLEIHNLTKTFPGVPALSSVDFTMYPGEVHALLGENGAGKSTLIKVITGVYKKNAGKILLDGKEIEPSSPHDAQALGISTVYQEVNLIPTLSVAENIYLGRQPKRWGIIDTGAAIRNAKRLLETYDIQIDVSQPLGSFSVAVQQIAAIARGVDLSAKILILDEPTSSLDANEVKTLFSVIRSLKEKGIGILLITHFLDQVYEISDRITILRNGVKVSEHLTKELPRMQLVSEMLGKELIEELSPHKVHKSDNQDVFLKVQGLGKRGVMQPFDLDIRKGEIVGLAGLLGSGRTETAQLIFGITHSDTGHMSINGTVVNFSSPRSAILRGFGLCPEDRKAEGIIGDLSIRENIILALQAKRGWFKFLNYKRQEQLADDMIKALHIATPDSQKVVKELSGGNQQKVILGRWLVSEPEFLILDEPTRGIDVGAHAEIISIIKDLCAKGMPLLVISSELAEVVDYSDRVVVLRDRKKVTELQRDEISQNSIMKAIAES
ncbi:MAG: ATP-binding cassette domain-containing protein [Anaerolineaceae bacterium]|nr:ATP-binding cassette domain-containing protein [Anaerolineaceae bacterium]